jgi:hypothetical protein
MQNARGGEGGIGVRIDSLIAKKVSVIAVVPPWKASPQNPRFLAEV